ncbi:WecB/TagA/CpsF family glycosyltransferase [Rhizobium sp. Leaf262]|uniref:WecB/TagA/CpsF family glycosyltransferase n=1 Tax=Rhizobium sp. Leaf262 TaxID=1736312 RepID=UPI000A5E3A30|nr:WecB/TagA/CpsF family glycosyltransferase [Rhizobium sp. Leaf262]
MIAKRQLLFGLHVDAVRMDDVINRCHAAVTTRKRLLLGVLNAAKVVKLRKNKILRDSMIECDLLLADGQSVVWASRLLRRPLPERVAGIDVFERLLQLAHRHSLSIALLGATPEVVKEVDLIVSKRYLNLKIVYRHHGFYSADEASKIAGDIRSSQADMLFLGITSPKKEIFLATYGSTLNVPVLHGVGGSFDIMAGLTARAPVAWQRAGMEWAYRLLQEPRRLAWRYLTTNFAFIGLTLVEMLHPSSAFSTHVRRTGERLARRLPTTQPHGGVDE